MTDWKVSNYVDPNYGQTWVYKENPAFPGIHFSFSVGNVDRTHVATNDSVSYYFGVTKSFNQGHRQTDEAILLKAWKDYYTTK